MLQRIRANDLWLPLARCVPPRIDEVGKHQDFWRSIVTQVWRLVHLYTTLPSHYINAHPYKTVYYSLVIIYSSVHYFTLSSSPFFAHLTSLPSLSIGPPPPSSFLLFLPASSAPTAVPGADGYLGRRLSGPGLELLPRRVVSLIIGRNSDPHVRDGCPERQGIIQSEQQVLVACVSVFVAPGGQVLLRQKYTF